MATSSVTSTERLGGIAGLGTPLMQLLAADSIDPGSEPSYQLCKIIWLYHPLGGKLVEKPVDLALSKPRVISVTRGPEERLKRAFIDEWQAIDATRRIANLAKTARCYGIGALSLSEDGVPTSEPVDPWRLADATLAVNTLDPLNTAGSLVLNQNPTALDFQHVVEVRVQGKTYHRSRTVVLMNGDPVYIAFTTSAYGYVGRSVFQRILYPLKSFVNSMITDDEVVTKAGLLVVKQKQASSIANSLMDRFSGIKRMLLQQGKSGNVLTVGAEDDVQSLNFQNLDGAYGLARKNVLDNIASGAPMPAKMMTEETFAEGFGEGTEDAKAVLQFIDEVRRWLTPAHEWFDRIVMYRAWNEEFYRGIQRDYPEYRDVDYRTAFYEWKNAFSSSWPNLDKEPESKRIEVSKVKMEATIALLEVLLPELKGAPDARVQLVQWAIANFNELKLLFGSALELEDDDLLDAFKDELERNQPPGGDDELDEPRPPRPFRSDASGIVRALAGVR